VSTHKRLVVFGSIAVVVVGCVLGGRALADSSSQVASFRTATVKRATVSQTEQRSGIIEPVAAGTVAFPISGVVTGVAVQPGQAVTAGQTLATLDTSALQAQLTAQQATLAAAQLTLSNALNGISTPTNGPSNGGSSTTRSAAPASNSSSSSGRSSGASGGGASSASLAPARQAVASGQQDVDSAMKAANVFLNAATSSCGTAPSSGSSGRQHGGSSTAASSTTSTTAPPSNSSQSDCAINLQAALQAQQQLADAQNKLAKAESALDSALSKATPSGSSSQGGGGSNAAASTPSLSGPTSAELVADQAAADAAQANVTAAQQDLAQGTIVSPIDGTVAAVNMKSGDHVSAASSTENVVVVGPGGYEVTTTVPVTDIGNVKLADAASVIPDGSGQAIDGKVVSIGVVPTTSGSTTAYPVVIGLNGSPDGLRNGGDASVSIILNQVTNVLAVPTSAVRTAGAGAFHIVQVLSGSKTQTMPVQVGAIGPDLTEIKSGLSEGQQVVIADLNAPLPSNTNTRIGAGGGGGFGGAGGAFGGATIGRGG